MANVKLTKGEEKKHTPIQKIIKEAKKNTPVLISYKMTAVISTGSFSNVTPEIVVQAKTLEDAKNFITPHIKELYQEFYLVTERRVPVTKVEVKETPAPEVIGKIVPLNQSAVKRIGETPVLPKSTGDVAELKDKISQKLEKMDEKAEAKKITVDGQPTGMVAVENQEVLNPQKTNEDIKRLSNGPTESLHSVPYMKARAAVDSCMSIEALKVIKDQVTKSVKLTENEKNALLMVVIVAKEKTLEL